MLLAWLVLAGFSIDPSFAEFKPSYDPTAPANRFPQEPKTAPVQPSVFENNLWQIEERKQAFSPVVLSPSRQAMAFTETRYLSQTQQVSGSLYVAPLPQAPPFSQTHQLPEDYYRQRALDAITAKQVKKAETIKPHWYSKRQPAPPPPVDPLFTTSRSDKTQVLSVGEAFLPKTTKAFETLTVVDWNEDGSQLLLKHRIGKLYNGIQVSHVLTVDWPSLHITSFPQVEEAVRFYWGNRTMEPSLDRLSWVIEPLGWQPGSNNTIELEAWGYAPQARYYLGHWQLNVATQAVTLINTIKVTIPVAQNGALVLP
ncbi:MAG: hypothetical protein QE263_05665 [Vampirovibrionales bacterium]|nr:hypothetical protein [Vampirovibrionales bacterium]